jgi:hypothetical protein
LDFDAGVPLGATTGLSTAFATRTSFGTGLPAVGPFSGVLAVDRAAVGFPADFGAGLVDGFTAGLDLAAGCAFAVGRAFGFATGLAFALAAGLVTAFAFGLGRALATGFFAAAAGLWGAGLRAGVFAFAGDFRAGLAGDLAMGLLEGGVQHRRDGRPRARRPSVHVGSIQENFKFYYG